MSKSTRNVALLLAICLVRGSGGVLNAQETTAGQEAPRHYTDRFGDPLPERAVARLGTTRFRAGVFMPQVVFSPDDKTLASADRRAGLVLWDASSGNGLIALFRAE